MTEMSEPDLWDDAGPFVYRILPETCLDAFFSEEREMLMITQERGTFWLGETRVAGQSSYPTLAEAKAAGDEQIEKMEARQDAMLLAAAGMDPSEWRVTHKDGLTLERIDGKAAIVADTSAQRQRWDAYAAGDDPVATDLASVAAALDALKGEMSVD